MDGSTGDRGGGLNEPERIGADDAGASAGGGGSRGEGGRRMDRAEAAGYPPDSGPEQRVMYVRPAFFRFHPLLTVGLALFPVGLGVLVGFVSGGSGVKVGFVTGGIAAAVCWLILVGMWFWGTRSLALEITNKRAVEIRGFFSRSRDEVLLDHIRNVTVRQSFYDRVMRIGRIGIASAGQAETEINIDGMPDPRKIREVLDLYRPLD